MHHSWLQNGPGGHPMQHCVLRPADNPWMGCAWTWHLVLLDLSLHSWLLAASWTAADSGRQSKERLRLRVCGMKLAYFCSAGLGPVAHAAQLMTTWILKQAGACAAGHHA